MRQTEYEADDAGRFTAGARECLAEALGDIGLEAPDQMKPTLLTRFHRITLAARSGSERLTCDLGVRLSSPDGETAELHEDMSWSRPRASAARARPIACWPSWGSSRSR